MEMIAVQYIIAFAMAMTNVFKKNLSKEAVPFVTIGLAVIFNVGNAAVFGGNMASAAQEAFIAGGILVGMFVGGDQVRKVGPTKTDRE